MPSYHDLFSEIKNILRTSIFDLPYGLSVTCTRVGIGKFWRNDRLVAGEYEGGYDLMLLVMSSATVSLLLMTL